MRGSLPFEAIKMDTEFELSTTDRFGGLLYDKKELAKSNEHYHKIHPTRPRKSMRAWRRKRRSRKRRQRPRPLLLRPKQRPHRLPQSPRIRCSRGETGGRGEAGMIEKADQIFVILAHWLVSFLPAWLQQPAMVLLGVVAIIVTFPALFAITVLLERKGLGRMQNRYGPNRVGPYGIFQPVADGLKSLTKEDIVRSAPMRWCIFLRCAPRGGRVHGLCGAAHRPQHDPGQYGRGLAVLLCDWRVVGAVRIHGRLVEPQQVLAAGAMRAVAQMISYEVPLLMSSVAVS